MPRKEVKLIVAAQRAAEARRIVENQRGLIATLKAKGESTIDAEAMLQVYLSSLKLLEDHEQRIRKEREAKKKLYRTGKGEQ
jgi:hypothetical protein